MKRTLFNGILNQAESRFNILLNVLMRKSQYLSAFLFLFAFQLIVACSNSEKKNDELPPVDPEELIAINKDNVIEEQEQIADYIKRYDYKMNKTETGLHFSLLEEGKGRKPTFKSFVTINYKVTFLDGSYCYSSDSSGVLQFTLGQSDEPSGLQEGLAKLKEGGKAIFIVPSYLGYGLTGDGNKVGSNQTLVYRVELLSVE